MIKGLFKRRKKAAVFVDYEYLFYSYTNMVGIRPTPSIYMDELKKEFDISEIFVFGDFSSAPICEELWKIRGFTNSIIETGNTYQRHKKDVTDFVMLDYIYQCMHLTRYAQFFRIRNWYRKIYFNFTMYLFYG